MEGSLDWPEPKTFQQGHLVNYGYDGEVALTQKFQASSSLVPGSKLNIQASVTWLSCKEVCIPGKAELELLLPVQNS